MDKVIKITIDNKIIDVVEGTTILEAAKSIGIDIPTLCYMSLEELCIKNKPTSCRICVVEVEGRSNLAPSCSTDCLENMVIYTRTPRVLNARRTVLELILSDHPFECLICHPVENMKIKCIVKNVTRAGIRAVYYKEEENPIIMFIARENNLKNEEFNKVKENDIIITKVIGIRYKLNDEHISIIGELSSSKKNKRKTTKKNVK